MSSTPTDPRAQLAEAIARLTDDQVFGMMKTVGVDMALQGVFLEMQRRFLPDRTQGKSITVLWDLATPDGPAPYQMTVADRGLSWQAGRGGEPDLVVGCTVIDFMRMMIGQLDSTEAFMTGQLRVSGDLQLVQELGNWFDLS